MLEEDFRKLHEDLDRQEAELTRQDDTIQALVLERDELQQRLTAAEERDVTKKTSPTMIEEDFARLYSDIDRQQAELMQRDVTIQALQLERDELQQKYQAAELEMAELVASLQSWTAGEEHEHDGQDEVGGDSTQYDHEESDDEQDWVYSQQE
jgi:predicted RNase H-like nuclease (RuvC/YqgF family)